jgi:uncharacterized protein with FMN-binding domain
MKELLMKRPAIVAALVLASLLFGAAVWAQKATSYLDGVYALDYKDAELGSVSVSVTVKDGRLASVSLPAGKGDVTLEDAPLADWLKAFVAAPDFMGVDAVSGASQSCDLIKYAVLAALKQAAVNK